MQGDRPQALTDWWCTSQPPGAVDHPKELDDEALVWIACPVPGTIAGAHRAAGIDLDPVALDARDWWLRTTFPGAAPSARLHFGGIATVADVWLNGELLLQPENMFRSHAVDIALRDGEPNELVVRCRAIDPLLAVRRPRPRWRTTLARHQNLRWLRTTLLGRTPSTPLAPAVGLWRPVELSSRPGVELSDRRVTVFLDGDDGVVRVDGELTATVVRATLVVGDRTAEASLSGQDGRVLAAEVRVPDAPRWWPATHGDQPRLPVQLDLDTGDGTTSIVLPAAGFRSVALLGDDEPCLEVNGTPVFCRGAVWRPVDPIGLAPSSGVLRAALEQARDAGMNLLRLSGDTVYESPVFHDLCDELGILVWQDLMLARMDYPVDDPAFVDELTGEVAEVLRTLQGRPSTAVVCGGTEIDQQAVMAGTALDPAAVALFDEQLRALVAAALPGVGYRPHSPGGGHVPFAVDAGVSHYFGVGAYLRDLDDARRASPRFVTECLALANVPDDEAVDELLEGGGAVHDPAWKGRTPRDPGTSWDFEDVRDHYVRELFGCDPLAVRMADPDHYLDLGRAASVEVMARTMSEWRRPTSTCRGALVLALRDLEPGCGWGLIDVHGRPKAAYYALRRVLQPRALLLSDEGVNGLDAWLVNDRAEPTEGEVVVSTFRGRVCTASVTTPVVVAARSSRRCPVDSLLGGFRDLTHAYRFGPPSVDTVALEWRDATGKVSRAVHHATAGPLARVDVGLEAVARSVGADRYEIEVTAVEAARCVLLSVPGCVLDDNAFDLAPAGRAIVGARAAAPPRGRVRAVNGWFSAGIRVEPT